MTRWAITADLNRCVGCQTCTSSCKQANATAPGVQWRKVVDFEAGEYPDVRRAFVPVGCMHCDEPPCLDVCPSTATCKREDGIVTIDYDVCIGCSYCAVACPYQARFRVDTPNEAYGTHCSMNHETVRENWDRRAVAQKCTLCFQRIDAGIAKGLTPGVDPEATPACVNSCIAGALQFGNADDPESNVSKLLRENHHQVMHEELGTGPGIHYLWERGEDDNAPVEKAEMVKDPVGLSKLSPVLQSHWDWRAAANFMAGGAGTGLLTASVLAGLFAPSIWLAVFIALVLVGGGLFCVWLEIGRPWRFLNVYKHGRRSWMSREAMVAIPLFGLGGAAWLLSSQVLGMMAAVFALIFLYCQGRILFAAKGIPAWRQNGIVSLIIATGLTEGVGLFAVIVTLAGQYGQVLGLATPTLLLLVAARFMIWRKYRGSLGEVGAPTETFRVLDRGHLNLSAPGQILIAALIIASPWIAGLPALAGLLAFATGWAFKFTLITKAAYTQGYAIDRMPARGAGTSAPGIKPGWTTS